MANRAIFIFTIITIYSFTQETMGSINQQQQNETIDKTSFRQLCEQTFDSENRSIEEIDKLFAEIDSTNKNGRLDGAELTPYKKWLNVLTKPKSALVIIDMQNDFIDGSLSIEKGPAKQNPREIIPLINRLLDDVRFDVIVYTLDWHPANHISFVDNVNLRELDADYNRAHNVSQKPKVFDTVKFQKSEGEGVVQKLWPKHCVQNTTGAELNPNLKFVNDSRTVIIYKGDNPDADSYSAFYDNQHRHSTPLDAELKKRNITDVYACGLAYDFCVAYTCFDALDLGYKTALLKSQSKGLDFKSMNEVDENIVKRGGVVVPDDEKLKRLVQGKEIPWQWATFVWKNLHKF